MDHNFTNKKKTFLGLNRSLFSLNKLRGFFAFIGNKLFPPRTIVINQIKIEGNMSKKEAYKMIQEVHRGLEEAMQRGRSV